MHRTAVFPANVPNRFKRAQVCGRLEPEPGAFMEHCSAVKKSSSSAAKHLRKKSNGRRDGSQSRYPSSLIPKSHFRSRASSRLAGRGRSARLATLASMHGASPIERQSPPSPAQTSAPLAHLRVMPRSGRQASLDRDPCPRRNSTARHTSPGQSLTMRRPRHDTLAGEVGAQ